MKKLYILASVLFAFSASVNVAAQCTIIPIANSDTPQVVCMHAPIATITYATTGATGATFSDLPPGVTGNFLNNTITISGTPTVAQTFAYRVTLIGGCAAVSATGTIEVNPLPEATASVITQTICSGSVIRQIQLTSTYNGTVYNWSRDNSFINGIGGSGTGNITGSLSNGLNRPVTVKFTITPQLTRQGRSCSGPQIESNVVVNPKPTVAPNPSSQSVCSDSAFKTIALNSNVGDLMRWSRDNLSFLGTPENGSGDISGSLKNNTDLPKTVIFDIRPFYFNAGVGCPGDPTIATIVVNPTPVINTLPSFTYCNAEIVPQINFSSKSPDSSFTWKSNPDIGFGISGSSFISGFTARNLGTVPIVATVTVSVVAGSTRCTGPDRSFTITVRPSPPRPNFTSLVNTRNIDTLSLCQGSDNINFNVTQPAAGVTYLWSMTAPQGPNAPQAVIRDRNDANTAITFNTSAIYAIKATATNTAYSCTDTASQIIRVAASTGFVERRIIIKQPGNLLVYPDNSLDPANGYQWGYDSLIRTLPDPAYNIPHAIPLQVYQTFVPDNRFIRNNQLDTTNYAFWVLLKQGECFSKVYYNGPYARPRPGVQQTAPVDVRVSVYPNPGKGILNVTTEGNMYGSITATIFNAFGQSVFTTRFLKTQPVLTQQINVGAIAAGVYHLVVNSSDIKKAATRIVIQY